MKKILIFCLVFFISQTASAATLDFLKESTDTTCVSVVGRSAESSRVVGDFRLVRTCIGTAWQDTYMIKGKVVSKKVFYTKYGEYTETGTYTPVSSAVSNSTGLTSVTPDTNSALKRHKSKILKLKQCGNGNDFYDGGADTDTITYLGNREQYFVTQHADGSFTFKDLIPCRADTDTVINIELFQFGSRLLTLENLHPDAVAATSKKATSVTITSPKSKNLKFALGEVIPLAWTVKNVPQNSQVLYNFTRISEGESGSVYYGSSAIYDQSGKLKKGSSKGSRNVKTENKSLPSPGLYRIDAKVKACGRDVCTTEASGLVDYPDITYATAESVVIQLVAKSIESTKYTVGYNGFESVQVNEKTLVTKSDSASTFTIKGTVSSSVSALTVAIVGAKYEGSKEWSSVGGLLKNGSGYITTSNTAKISGGTWSAKFDSLPSGFYHIFVYDSAKTLVGDGIMISK